MGFEEMTKEKEQNTILNGTSKTIVVEIIKHRNKCNRSTFTGFTSEVSYYTALHRPIRRYLPSL